MSNKLEYYNNKKEKIEKGWTYNIVNTVISIFSSQGLNGTSRLYHYL